MAKKKTRNMSRLTEPTVAERLQWDAEKIAEEGIKETPTFKKAVKVAKGHIEEARRDIKKAFNPQKGKR